MTGYEPPAQYPYPYAGAPLKSDTSRWAVAAFCAALLYAVCEVTALLASVPLAREVQVSGTLDTVSPMVLLLNGGASLLGLVAVVTAWVLTCVWLMKARDNAFLLSPGIRQRRGTAWLWLGWVVPFANFVVPFHVVSDVLRASEQRSRGNTSGTALVGWWWACWLAILIGGRIHSRMLDGVGSAEGSSADAVRNVGAVLVLLTVAGIVLWGLLVRRVVDSQAGAEVPAAR
ncbi:DUF4328 domain-containing protein [Nocardioides lijunqiniae]|uniref:DUF4328 domain-containing protein n=1 Tax=Nocardioides lijunqiniae TaxID=2760832 RepID=UPI0018784184|nr:DUF4328 domain-containing protein [Nocardioides lijunqiniae]